MKKRECVDGSEKRCYLSQATACHFIFIDSQRGFVLLPVSPELIIIVYV